MKDSFAALSTLNVAGEDYRMVRLEALEKQGWEVSRLPYCLRILLENLLRREDGDSVPADDIEHLAQWDPQAIPAREIAFMPGRVLLQDFTGVPAVADLAAMRDAVAAMGGDPGRINPLQPVELVIDHSVQVDEYGSSAAFLSNANKEFERNHERYAFLRWGQSAFHNFRVVPPDTGIVHQVNLEYLARVVMSSPSTDNGMRFAFPDTLVGADSHTTMINGLGVLGWGVGGIEAEAAMLGQPISMLIPQVVGFRFTGELGEGATATDLVLTVTQKLRAKGVVGKFVEFFGPGLAKLPLADRATIANMAPEYGATCGIFPVDQICLDYVRFTGREDRVALAEAYMKEQGLFHSAESPEAAYSDVLELDLGTVEPSLAGPKRPQDRILLGKVKQNFLDALPELAQAQKAQSEAKRATESRLAVLDSGAPQGGEAEESNQELALDHGSVVIAAITSCTNTSNPSVMLAAGLLAKKAVEAGLKTRPWVKTSLAPGSKVVTDYLNESGCTPFLEELGFHLVGYGCTTCIGNSGPLPGHISRAIRDGNVVAVSVLSGNRNFEGRISPEVRGNYLASPPLVVAYALAGRIDVDLHTEPLGTGADGKPVFLKDIWPSRQEIGDTVARAVRPEMFKSGYSDVFAGDERWNSLVIPQTTTYDWGRASTYVKKPPFFDDMPATPPPVEDILGARALAVLGETVTTDHISPAGGIQVNSAAGKYLQASGVAAKDFNSYGARRGNHEVMMRGTFANVRLRNRLVPGVEGPVTLYLPQGEQMSIFDAAMRYQEAKVPLVILAGAEYGTGSSRDYAAKGPRLLGVRAVLARSFERIHRSNLVGMGIVPLEFLPEESVENLGLTGHEAFDIVGLAAAVGSSELGEKVSLCAHKESGETVEFQAVARLDTPQERLYYRHGGILQYVLRQLVTGDN